MGDTYFYKKCALNVYSLHDNPKECLNSVPTHPEISLTFRSNECQSCDAISSYTGSETVVYFARAWPHAAAPVKIIQHCTALRQCASFYY